MPSPSSSAGRWRRGRVRNARRHIARRRCRAPAKPRPAECSCRRCRGTVLAAPALPRNGGEGDPTPTGGAGRGQQPPGGGPVRERVCRDRLSAIHARHRPDNNGRGRREGRLGKRFGHRSRRLQALFCTSGEGGTRSGQTQARGMPSVSHGYAPGASAEYVEGTFDSGWRGVTRPNLRKTLTDGTVDGSAYPIPR
jgi:hypothetical protein